MARITITDEMVETYETYSPISEKHGLEAVALLIEAQLDATTPRVQLQTRHGSSRPSPTTREQPRPGAGRDSARDRSVGGPESGVDSAGVVRTGGRPVSVYDDIKAERARQDAKWGQQNHPDNTGPHILYLGFTGVMELQSQAARRRCQANTREQDNWQDILLEEVFEAMAESDPAALRAELIQVAAVAAQWVEAIDRRTEADRG